MCKSPNQEMMDIRVNFLVLMLNELPNWLLFRALQRGKVGHVMPLTGICC